MAGYLRVSRDTNHPNKLCHLPKRMSAKSTITLQEKAQGDHQFNTKYLMHITNFRKWSDSNSSSLCS